MSNSITSPVFVCKDNIDTDQIIPAQYLTLVPTIEEEYKKLGSFALIGLPDDLYPVKFIAPGDTETPYKIVIAGRNFGCGSSREHAPIAMGAAGVAVVVAVPWRCSAQRCWQLGGGAVAGAARWWQQRIGGSLAAAF